MLLHTIVPLETVMEEEMKEFPPEFELKDGGVTLLCQPTPSGEMTITRLISTDPQDYLKPQWQPGSNISRH